MNRKLFHYTVKQTFGYKQRTWITFISIVSAVSLLMLAQGFIEWMVFATQEAYAWNEISHIQVHKEGYKDNFTESPNAYLIDPPPIAEIKQLDPEIAHVSGDLFTGGLISYNDNIIAAQLIGTNIVEHSRVFQSIDTQGLVYSPKAGPADAVIGKELKNMLELKNNDMVILLANTVQRSQNAIELKVTDYFQTSNQALDMTTLKVPIDRLQSLMRTDKVHQWSIYLYDTDETKSVAKKLEDFLKARYPDYRITEWFRIADFYNKTRDLFDKQLGTLVTLMTCIMFLGLLNIFAINILNRRKEIATAKAVGYNNKQIFAQFFAEGVIWGFCGGISGVLIGYALCEVVSFIGIPMPPAPGMSHGFTAHIHLTQNIIFKSFIVVAATTILSNVLPAIRAATTNVIYAFGTKLT
jgi:putative ABC transport system permease protein